MWMLVLRFWPYVAAFGLLISAVVWHKGEVREARREGAESQRKVDEAAYRKAAEAAQELQRLEVERVERKANIITKEIADALENQRDDVAQRYNALRLRWAKAKADTSRTDGGAVSGLANTTPGADDQACAARGWVDFEAAATIAQAADEAVMKDDAWREWWEKQAAARE